VIVVTIPVNGARAALTGGGFVVVDAGCGRVVDAVDDDARRAVGCDADDPHAPVVTSATAASALANR
jgi:hypothetical protein